VIDEKEEFQVIGKTFKGLTDQEFENITEELLKLKINDNQYTVFVKPQIVVEVAFNEIQKSPQYKSGYALRFARIKRIRYDKSPYEATSINEIKYLYKIQFEKKGKLEI
ncbi:MAG: DNA ligase, partial [Candidatus Helarchaeota archaeon]|nr:DNA ligase [Candidatus Helarchaeota archaeon]